MLGATMDDVRSLFRHLYCGSELFDAILAVSAEGIYVHDTEGRVYIDCASGTFDQPLGHNHPALVQAIQQQAATLSYVGSPLTNELTLQLAAKLVSISPPNLNRVHLRDLTGSTAVEGAIKIAQIATGRRDVITPIVSGSLFARRWSFQMQAVNMSDQFSFRGPATEVETQHLICPLGRCLSDPQADQQARNKGRIHLEAYPVDPLTQQMPAAQHTFDPAEKQLHRPPIAIRHGQQLGIQVQPIRDQDHDVWRPILPRLARGDLHQAERLRQHAGMVRRAQAAEDRITHDTRMVSAQKFAAASPCPHRL